MIMNKLFTTILLQIILLFALNKAEAQNITDLSISENKSEEARMWNIADSPCIDDSIFLHPDRICYDHRCFKIDGQDVFLLSGAFHYFRVPQELWADRFKKLKAAGLNCIETYIPWNWHEREMPSSVNDYSHIDMSQLDDFLKMAESYGLYVIVRPGPYICAEWSGGGFPQWIMQKRPKKTAFDVWLQSDDDEFLSWNEHWYRAVCQTVGPHQITSKPVGSKGVILFQIENEYNRVNWFPRSAKKHYLEQLATMARRYGINVPLLTCWTDESRNVAEGPLCGVIDMVNSYPRWQVEQRFGGLVDKQMQSQAGRPLVAGELQGGWCCELGWQLSWQQDGLPPVQTQNILLYAMQRGFAALNFYMMVGGTNFDDWAARQQVTSYDYAAAIGEDGSTNERYRRFCGLSKFIERHGTRIARANLMPTEYTSTDPTVELAVRQTIDGDRYFFIRTEEHSRQHFGTITTANLRIDFELEPFGSKVYYLPATGESGEWFPKLPETQVVRTTKAEPIELKKIDEWADAMPQKWTRLRQGETIDSHGIYGRHFVYYKTRAKAGRTLEIGRAGRGAVNGSAADTVLVFAGGQLVPIAAETKDAARYLLPGDSLQATDIAVTMLFESKGLHHHTNRSVEQYWTNGLQYVRQDGKDLPLSYAYVERERGIAYSLSANTHKEQKGSTQSAMLTWSKYEFNSPRDSASILHLHLEQQGNGFIYVNGHCIARCWEQGPQRDYYIPECWLYTDRPNIVAISLRPTDRGTQISNISIICDRLSPEARP